MAEEGYLNTVYRGDPSDTTEWDDIQRKLGNFAPKAAIPKPPAYTAEVTEAHDEAWMDKKSEAELVEAADEYVDDRFLEEYRWGWMCAWLGGVHGRKRMLKLAPALHGCRILCIGDARTGTLAQLHAHASG